jgi:hypothetical protein
MNSAPPAYHVYTITQLKARIIELEQERHMIWNKDWKHITATNELEFVGNVDSPYRGYKGYRIDLDRCKSAEEMVDWILHMFEKGWVSPQIMYSLISALREIQPYGSFYK